MKARTAVSGVSRVNGAELYHEVRGSGPSLLLIHGTGADAGCYDALAGLLADEFTVLTYDRRGWSRSPRPAGWEQTSIKEQADDAAWLVRATGMAPVTVFGSSSGALIALDLALRHPGLLSGAVLHEPVTFTLLPSDYVQEQFAAVTPLMERAIAAEGPRGGQRTLLEYLAEDGIARFPAQLRERWLESAAVFAIEFPAMLFGYRPEEAPLRAMAVPVVVARAASSPPLNQRAAARLGEILGVEPREMPGGHLAYLEHPDDFAVALRPLLSRSP